MRSAGPSSGMGSKKKLMGAVDVQVLLPVPFSRKLHGVFDALAMGVSMKRALLRRLALLLLLIERVGKSRPPGVASPLIGVGAFITGASHSMLLREFDCVTPEIGVTSDEKSDA